MWKIKTAIILIFTLLLLIPSIVRAHEEVGGMVRIVNGYHVRLILPDVIQMGENQFQVVITGADGLPVSGAMLEAAAQPVSQAPAHSHDPAPASTADPMTGMTGMDMSTPAAPVTQGMDGHAGKTVKLSAAPQAGLYQGAISFSKDGAWALTSVLNVILFTLSMVNAVVHRFRSLTQIEQNNNLPSKGYRESCCQVEKANLLCSTNLLRPTWNPFNECFSLR